VRIIAQGRTGLGAVRPSRPAPVARGGHAIHGKGVRRRFMALTPRRSRFRPGAGAAAMAREARRRRVGRAQTKRPTIARRPFR